MSRTLSVVDEVQLRAVTSAKSTVILAGSRSLPLKSATAAPPSDVGRTHTCGPCEPGRGDGGGTLPGTHLHIAHLDCSTSQTTDVFLSQEKTPRQPSEVHIDWLSAKHPKVLPSTHSLCDSACSRAQPSSVTYSNVPLPTILTSRNPETSWYIAITSSFNHNFFCRSDMFRGSDDTMISPPASAQMEYSVTYSSSVCPGHRLPGGEGPGFPWSGPGSVELQPCPPV
mmetsp:Transcript_26852/g.70518  ORF Transcript_26852/g.70518 Transcript_26852/m.70518 type:complete len:226 (+) Transcript_26852:274-951(+)